MRPLNARQIAVLVAAPISVDVDYGNGDPHRGPVFRYHGVDGRSASMLWGRGLLKYESTNPFGPDGGGLLRRTRAGDDAVDQSSNADLNRARDAALKERS